MGWVLWIRGVRGDALESKKNSKDKLRTASKIKEQQAKHKDMQATTSESREDNANH